MTIKNLSCLAACALILGAVGCDQIAKSTKPSESQEQKSKNLGDQYVRGILGTGNNAKGTIGVVAIQKAVQMYQVEKGKNPASLAALHSEGYLTQKPTAPQGQRFEYDAASGSVKLVRQ